MRSCSIWELCLLSQWLSSSLFFFSLSSDSAKILTWIKLYLKGCTWKKNSKWVKESTWRKMTKRVQVKLVYHVSKFTLNLYSPLTSSSETCLPSSLKTRLPHWRFHLKLVVSHSLIQFDAQLHCIVKFDGIAKLHESTLDWKDELSDDFTLSKCLVRLTIYPENKK